MGNQRYIYLSPDIGLLLDSAGASRFVNYLFTKFFVAIFAFYILLFGMSVLQTAAYRGMKSSRLLTDGEMNSFRFFVWDEVKNKNG
ncbi:MAG: hypothetical protein OQK12_10695 [Motiliproteus sp.]|nr:hypothetical protein [Motiliproteus sp.]MCW9054244.1 hypothetical protein [Motiliproteus sp.]